MKKRIHILVDIVVLVVLLCAAFQQPHGGWDAWAIWNTKAKFIASDSWNQLFSPHLAWMHPDYPLLLPLIIAGMWTLLGTATHLIPLAIAVLFSWSLYLLVKHWVGLWPALLMISLPAFIRWSGSQYADIPLALFLLLGLWFLYKQKFLFSGLAFGLAIFTKNEGMMYFILILVTFLLVFRNFKPVASMLLGASPGIIPLFIIKHLAPTNEFLAHAPTLSMERFPLVLNGFAHEFLTWKEWGLFWFAVVALFVLLPKKTSWSRFFSLFLGLCCVAFFLIYLATPQDVTWHIATSFNRLLIQILPVIIVALGMQLKSYLDRPAEM